MLGDDHDKACGGNCGCKSSKTGLVEQMTNLVDELSKKKNPRVLTGYEDIDDFLEDCLDTMKKKGHDYRQGNDDDVLHNFRTVAESVGIGMEKVWFTYFYKHYSALATFIKEGGQSESEPIEGRVKDLIVYLLLFSRMLNEKKKKNAEQTRKLENLVKSIDFKVSKSVDEGINIKAKPTLGPVVLENGVVNVDVNRLRKLAGLEGLFYDPEILKRGGEITKVLLERDGKYVKFGGDRIEKEHWFARQTQSAKEARYQAFNEAVKTSKPLDQRELEAAETIALIAEREEAQNTGKMDEFLEKYSAKEPKAIPFGSGEGDHQ